MDSLATALRPQYPPVVQATAAEFVLGDGRTVVDLSAQTLNLAHGHTHPRITTAVIEQAQQAQFASSRFASRPFLRLAARLVELAPAGLDRVVLKLANGSDAVETAVKIATGHTRRPLIGCLPGAWHGESIATLGMATSHAGRGLAETGRAVFADEPGLAALTRLVSDRGDDLAAVVLDPAQVSHGLTPDGLDVAGLMELRAVCDRAGTLLVFDEIQTFGWLGGGLFVADRTGVSPDVICLGKALGAGYPLAAVLCRTELGGVLSYNDAEFTYGGHPVSCAAALAGLTQLTGCRSQLIEREDAFTALLTEAFPAPEFEVRQVALMATITCSSDRLREHWGAQTAAACMRAGVYVRLGDHGRRLLIKPPLVLGVDELRDALTIVADHGRRALAELDHDLRHARPLSRSTAPSAQCGLARYRPREDASLDEVRALLHEVVPGVSARARTASEQHAVTSRLTEIGVPAPVAYPALSMELNFVDEVVPPGRTLEAVLGDPSTESAVVNAMVLRHYELITRAHDHGMVLGDRFPRRAIVTARGDLHLVDLDVTYIGPAESCALAEEASCVVTSITAIHSGQPLRGDLLDRLIAALCRRHGAATVLPVLNRAAAHLAGQAGEHGEVVPDGSDSLRAAILGLSCAHPAGNRQSARPA